MLKKIGGLARALYIVLAIVAGFVALGAMDVALILVVLGLVAGLAVPRDRMVLLAALRDCDPDRRNGAWPSSFDRCPADGSCHQSPIGRSPDRLRRQSRSSFTNS